MCTTQGATVGLTRFLSAWLSFNPRTNSLSFLPAHFSQQFKANRQPRQDRQTLTVSHTLMNSSHLAPPPVWSVFVQSTTAPASGQPQLPGLGSTSKLGETHVCLFGPLRWACRDSGQCSLCQGGVAQGHQESLIRPHIQEQRTKYTETKSWVTATQRCPSAHLIRKA